MRVRLDGIVHIGLVTVGVCGVMLGLAIAPWVEKAKKILEQGLLILEKRVRIIPGNCGRIQKACVVGKRNLGRVYRSCSKCKSRDKPI